MQAMANQDAGIARESMDVKGKEERPMPGKQQEAFPA
jgi:hypothetical protein